MELSTKVDYLAKSPSQQLSAKYLNNEDASRILHISRRTLAKMRNDGAIPYIKVRRRILYEASDLQSYIQSNSKRR